MRRFRFPFVLLFVAGTAYASVRFTPRELFRIPFGDARGDVGSRVENGHLLIPRNFTIDDNGHFYIYDASHHRIARYSPDGTYEMEFHYLDTAQSVFAHVDAHENLWLLISDPSKGIFCGVYSPQGQRLKAAIFTQYNHFRLHVDDGGALHVVLSSDKNSSATQTYLLDEKTLLMKKENVGPPPENHHELRDNGRLLYVDPALDATAFTSHPMTRITDSDHRRVADIEGDVIYVTAKGEIYTKVGARQLRVYDARGALKGTVTLTGLSSSCSSLRFDADGDIYQLDGIPDIAEDDPRLRAARADPAVDREDLHYSGKMPGMRVIEWQRKL